MLTEQAGAPQSKSPPYLGPGTLSLERSRFYLRALKHETTPHSTDRRRKLSKRPALQEAGKLGTRSASFNRKTKDHQELRVGSQIKSSLTFQVSKVSSESQFRERERKEQEFS